jgi:PAS domain S-box-containing protein
LLSNTKLAVRLGVGFGVMLALLGAVGFFAVTRMNQLSNLNRQLYEHPFAVQRAVLAIDGNVIRMHRAMKDVALSRNEADFTSAVATVDELEKKTYDEFKIVEERFLGEPAMYIRAETLFKQWRPIRQEVIGLVRDGEYVEAAEITRGKGNTHVLQIIASLNQLHTFAQNMAARFYNEAQTAHRQAFTMMCVIIVIAVAFGVIFTIFITRSISAPAREIARVSEAIADGELTSRITYQGSDEIGQMADSLRRMLAGVIGEGQSIKNGIITPLWTADTNLIIKFLNPAAAQIAENLCGLKSEEIVGRKNVGEILADKDGIVEKMARKSLSDGDHLESEISFTLGDADLILHESTSRLLDLNGKTIGVMGVGVDITARLQSEQERNHLQEQLRQSQKMEAVGTLAGGVAHDFNNILSAIIGYTELTLHDLDDQSPFHRNLELVLQSSWRARDLVKRLLAFSRKQLMEMKTFVLNDLVAQNRLMLERIIGEDISLKIFMDKECGLVKADFHQLEQVLMNLVANARDAMPGGGTIAIETACVELDEEYAAIHAEAAPGPHVMVAVSDDGPGMDEITKEHMFDPFFTTKDIGKGTGLGLAMVYGIVKQLGGNIYVYSELGQGTTIKVYLPRVRGEAEEYLQAEGQSDQPVGNETILVVEDEEMVREFIQQTLKSRGYKVLQASNGPEALELIANQEEHIDMLLTDVIMPQMSGKELFERLKVDRPDLKALYISGYTDNVIAHHGLVDRGVDFLQKPVSIVSLAQKIRIILDRPK